MGQKYPRRSGDADESDRLPHVRHGRPEHSHHAIVHQPGSNQRLDAQGFAPFGMVVEGMSVVQSLNKEYLERPDQESIRQHGNKYLNEQFPKLDYIKKAEVLPAE